MKQAILIFSKTNKIIESARKKYDPLYKEFKSHITVAFPFENVSQKKLEKHITNAIKGIKPFELVLKGVRKSPKEFYLYLLVNKGKKELIKIHKKLYSKLLTKHLRKDIPYIPHVTIGIFHEKKYIDKALKELRNKKVESKTKVNSISLITLNKKYKNESIKEVKKFYLN